MCVYDCQELGFPWNRRWFLLFSVKDLFSVVRTSLCVSISVCPHSRVVVDVSVGEWCCGWVWLCIGCVCVSFLCV